MTLQRRQVLQLALAIPGVASPRRTLRGIFPIMQTPFTADDRVDFPVLAKQAVFLDRTGAHGMVWPQLASEYAALSADERMTGMETLAKAAKGGRPALVLGVQADQPSQAVEYARHATRLGADAIIAIPPKAGKAGEQETIDYYRTIGEASGLPMFIQALGDISVDLIIKLSRAVPTLRYIKDESGPVLQRVSQFRERAPELGDFTGSHGRVLFEEMIRGSAGNMPAAAWVDLYNQAWDFFHRGRRKDAAAMCARSLLFVMMAENYGLESIKYVLHLRGVFPNWKVRSKGKAGVAFDEPAMQTARDLVDAMRPYFKT